MNYERLKQTHTDMLSRLGQGTVALVQITTEPGANEWDPPVTTETVTPLAATVRGVSQEYVDGSQVLSSDLWVQMAVITPEPAVGDRIRIDGVDHVILRLDRLPGAGEAVALRAWVRG